MTSSPLPAAAILNSGCRQNAMESEALSWLVSTLFPSLFSPPKCSLSLGQWQEEVAGPEMALPLWCERGFGAQEVVQMVTQGRRNLAVENCVHVTCTQRGRPNYCMKRG